MQLVLMLEQNQYGQQLLTLETTINETVDAFGLLCPLPIIKVAAAIKKLAPGSVIELISTDPGVIRDMEDWCKANRHEYISDETDGRTIRLLIRKGDD